MTENIVLKNGIKISFEEGRFHLFKPVLTSSTGKRYEIPLLLESYSVMSTIDKLNIIKDKIQLYTFDSLRQIVAGAAKISMKY